MGLYDAAGHKVADMPFGTIESKVVRYVPFKRMYLIERERLREFNGSGDVGPSALLVDDPHIGWWLYPSGKVEETLIPPRTPIMPRLAGKAQSMRYHPTAKGILFDFNTREANSGAYLALDEKRLVKVVDGAPSYFSVSPNGCKVAFWYAPRLGENAEELAYVDVCQAVQR